MIKEILPVKSRQWYIGSNEKDNLFIYSMILSNVSDIFSSIDMSQIILNNKIENGKIDALLVPCKNEKDEIIFIKDNSKKIVEFRKEKNVYEKNIVKGDIIIGSIFDYYGALNEYIFISYIYLNRINIKDLLDKNISNNNANKYILLYNTSTKEISINDGINFKLYDIKGKDFRFENQEKEVAIKIEKVEEYGFVEDVTRESLAKKINNGYQSTKFLTFDKPLRKKDLIF